MENASAAGRSSPDCNVATVHDFGYRGLDIKQKEIRLLIVQPGLQDDPVHGTFKYACLSHSPITTYETISYVWGDASVRGSIYLHGQPTDVPASTEAVLRRMRHKDQDRILWIDAVCINQTDLDERGNQVAMMAEIYGKTSCNLIWLGKDDDGTNEQALQSISAILKDMKIETNDLQELTRKLYGTQGNWLWSTTGISTSVDWPSFLQYLASRWFTRLWVVQEACLPAKSICYRGSSELPLEDVLRAACWTAHKAYSLPTLEPSNGIKCAVGIAMYADHEYGRSEILYKKGQLAATLSLLADSLDDFDAHDPRDQIYGMLGLYQKYINPRELPASAANSRVILSSNILLRSRSIDFLVFPGTQEYPWRRMLPPIVGGRSDKCYGIILIRSRL